MAVAFDAASSTSSAAATSLTFSHTCTGSDRALGVGVTLNDTAATTVTYNSVSMTQEVAVGTGSPVRLYELENPTTGANNVVVSIGVEVQVIAGAVSVTGADQTDCVSNNASATGFSSSPSVAVTSASGELVLAAISSAAVTWTAGTGETERWDLAGGGLAGWGGTEDGASSVTINPTQSATEDWRIVAMSFRAAPPTGSPGGYYLLENGTDRYLLEDGTGLYLMEETDLPPERWNRHAGNPLLRM